MNRGEQIRRSVCAFDDVAQGKFPGTQQTQTGLESVVYTQRECASVPVSLTHNLSMTQRNLCKPNRQRGRAKYAFVCCVVLCGAVCVVFTLDCCTNADTRGSSTPGKCRNISEVRMCMGTGHEWMVMVVVKRIYIPEQRQWIALNSRPVRDTSWRPLECYVRMQTRRCAYVSMHINALAFTPV